MILKYILLIISVSLFSCSTINSQLKRLDTNRDVSGGVSVLSPEEFSSKASKIIESTIDSWEIDDRILLYKPNTGAKKQTSYCFRTVPRNSSYEARHMLIDFLKQQDDLRAVIKQIFFQGLTTTHGKHPEFADILLEKMKNSQPIKLEFQSLWRGVPEEFFFAGSENPYTGEKVPYNQSLDIPPSDDGCYHTPNATIETFIAQYVPDYKLSKIEFNLQHFGRSTKPRLTEIYKFLTATDSSNVHVENKLSLFHEYFHHLDMDYLDKNMSFEEKKKNGGMSHRKYVTLKLGRPLQKDAVFSCSHLVQTYEPKMITFLAAKKVNHSELDRRRVTYDSCMTCLTSAFTDVSVNESTAHKQCSQYPPLKLY